MDRRKFINHTALFTLGASAIPIGLRATPTGPTGFAVREYVVIDEESWLLPALTTFAKYMALDQLATHTWDYLFNKLKDTAPEKAAVESTTSMMRGGGFNDFRNSPVYQNNYYGTVLYDAAKRSSVEDVCVGVTRTGSGASTPLMLDGPAIGMMAYTAQDAVKNGYTPSQARQLLFPSGKVHQSSTGNLQTGYSKPIVYDTQEGNRVAIGYKVESGIGKGEIVVADLRDKTTLTQKLFEFAVA